MNRSRLLGLAQEAASVAWTVLAFWTCLPGGLGAAVLPVTGLVLSAVLIAILAVVRDQRPAGPPSSTRRERRRLASH